MKKNYIKMNDNKLLSLGNVINTIKKISNNNSAMQLEIFCSIFGINNINVTTVNNYCIGIRAIGLEYKKIFEDNYNNDSLISNILSIVSILDNKIYSYDENSINVINNSSKLYDVVKELLLIAKNDDHINDSTFFNDNNNYNSMKKILYYAIIENKQPVYTQKSNIKYDKNELNDYMNLKLFWGQSYIANLIDLAKKKNIYACAELASLEYDGLISGEPNYENAYKYYLIAANKNHPKACWMISNMMINGKVKNDFNTMWKYLNKSIELGSAAGYNTMGLCYLKGINKENKIDLEKSEYYFKLASDLGYIFAFNNLGKLYEKKDKEKSIKYYKISADMNDSWALNKVGEYYRNKNDYKNAFMYYTKSIECPIKERCKYGYYNLARYYYENGCKDVNITRNEKIAEKYYKIFEKMK